MTTDHCRHAQRGYDKCCYCGEYGNRPECRYFLQPDFRQDTRALLACDELERDRLQGPSGEDFDACPDCARLQAEVENLQACNETLAAGWSTALELLAECEIQLAATKRA